MNKLLGILLILIIFLSCKSEKKEITTSPVTSDYQDITTEAYELSKPTDNIKKVLVLFGGFPEEAQDIKREFKILDLAKKNNVAVLYMNYNQKLWLEAQEKKQLAEQLQIIFIENSLPTTDLYLGGFSSGGNVSLLISAYLIENTQYNLEPKGVFIVDSPIDLLALYQSSEKNLERDFSEPAVEESRWIIETLRTHLGTPTDSIANYEDYAVYTSKTNTISNLKSLKNIKIRLYTEPDTLWWKENRKADYYQMNAFYIKKLSESLKDSGFDQVEYIPTENKGYRANGERHPHSWAIVDKQGLIEWILE